MADDCIVFPIYGIYSDCVSLYRENTEKGGIKKGSPSFVNTKLFWWGKIGTPLYITEGIWDALRLISFGENAICTFGLPYSNQQVSFIVGTGADKVIIAFDNFNFDLTGRKNSIKLYNDLEKWVDVSILDLQDYKDTDEIPFSQWSNIKNKFVKISNKIK